MTPEYVLTSIGFNLDDLYINHFPGYFNDVSKPVIVADWNKITDEVYRETGKRDYSLQNRVERLIENMGYIIEWDDNGICCDNCFKFTPTKPGFHGDLETAIIFDGYALCPNCIRDNPEDYLESLINNPDNADKILGESLEDLGFIRLNKESYQSGFHPGQTDDGYKVTKLLRDSGEKRDLIFSIDCAGQFDVHFSVYARQDKD